MSGKVGLAWRYLIHWLEAVDQHSLQAPFAYHFFVNVIKNTATNPQFANIQLLRKSLVNDPTKLNVADLGTGSGKIKWRRVMDMAKNSNQPEVSRLLFNIARHRQPEVILELGTNLGLSTLQLAAGSPGSKILTIEGCPQIAKFAQDNFLKLGAPQIQVIHGPLEQVLSDTVSKLTKIDLLYIDANHQYQPTIDYFSECIPKIHQRSVVVLDDIYWSKGMRKAWKEIKNRSDVIVTFDLFKAGLVFFDTSLSKMHYKVSF